MSLGRRNPNDPIGSGSMDSCNHDKRFSGVFDLPRDCHGCLACYAEKLAAEGGHLQKQLDRFETLADNKIDKLQAEVGHLKQEIANIDRLTRE